MCPSGVLVRLLEELAGVVELPVVPSHGAAHCSVINVVRHQEPLVTSFSAQRQEVAEGCQVCPSGLVGQAPRLRQHNLAFAAAGEQEAPQMSHSPHVFPDLRTLKCCQPSSKHRRVTIGVQSDVMRMG